MRMQERAAALALNSGRPKENVSTRKHGRSPRRQQYEVAAAVRQPDGTERTVYLVGRFAQTLVALVRAGEHGITQMEFTSSGATRLSGYVHRLRRDWGLRIETRDEAHQTDIGSVGRHARYILQDTVLLLPAGDGGV